MVYMENTIISKWKWTLGMFMVVGVTSDMRLQWWWLWMSSRG